MEFNLFRTKFIVQEALFRPPPTPRLFAETLRRHRSIKGRHGHVWHIGNLRFFDATSGSFAIGRTTKATVAKYDDEEKNFTEEPLETSPYTLCVFDTELGIVGIARNNALATRTDGLARRLRDILHASVKFQPAQVDVEVLPIRDPTTFLKQLQHAYRVTRFTATFRGPNPFDADEHFQRPLSVYLSNVGGAQGKAEVKGADLNRDVIQEVARSTSATGNQASARIIPVKGKPSRVVSLEGEPLTRQFEPNSQPEQVLGALQEAYATVRIGDD